MSKIRVLVFGYDYMFVFGISDFIIKLKIMNGFVC